MNNGEQDSHSRSIRSYRQMILVVLLILLSFVLLIAFVDLKLVYGQLKTANWWLVIFSSFLLLPGYLIYSIAWRYLLQNKPGVSMTFNAANIGHFGNIYVPLRAGELMRILVMGKVGPLQYAQLTASVMIEKVILQIMRLFGLFAMVTLGFRGASTVESVFISLIFLGATAMGIQWVIRNEKKTVGFLSKWVSKFSKWGEIKIQVEIRRFIMGLKLLGSVRMVSATFGMTILSWLFFVVEHYLLTFAFPNDLTSTQAIALSIGVLAIAPPTAPTQPGLFHISVIGPLVLLGYDAVVITTFTVLLHLQQMFLITILGFWGFHSTKIRFGDLLPVRIKPVVSQK